MPADLKEKAIIEKLKYYSFNNIDEGNDLIFFSPTMFTFIGCKELSSGEDYSTFYAVFNEKNILTPFKKPSDTLNFCEKLGVKKSKTYFATDYPIHVPVYYFQGTTDGATTAENAIWHYKHVAKAHAQLILSKNYGHAPVITNLSQSLDTKQDNENEAHYAERIEIVKLFKAAVNNETIELGELNKIINEKTKSWVITQK